MWEEVQAIAGTIRKDSWMLVGDFNETLSVDENMVQGIILT